MRRGPLSLPSPLVRLLDAHALRLMQPPDGPPVDFANPAGEAALLAADSLSWRTFKNPVTVFIGGVAAVILELAEPAVRAGSGRIRASSPIPCGACGAPAWQPCPRSTARRAGRKR